MTLELPKAVVDEMVAHAREDLPKLVAQLRAAHPAVPVELMAAAGEDPRLTALMARS